MRGRAATETVTLHHALKALALGGANNVNVVFLCEDRGLHLIAGLVLFLGTDPELFQLAHRRHAGFAEVPLHRFGHRPRSPLVDETELHSLVAVGLGRSSLYYETRSRLYYRDRNHPAVGRVDLRHPELSTQ